MTADAAWAILRYGTVGSTQAVAATLVGARARHRTVVVAEQQTAGYGRKGDAWQDIPDASLLMTLILRPVAPAPVPHYAMIAGLAGLDAIRDATGLNGGIKWPNDVLLDGRKVAGILGDAMWRGDHLDAVRLGIGVNVGGERAAFAARGLPGATSIAAEAGRLVDREAFLQTILAAFAQWEDAMDAGHGADAVAAWRASVVTCGREVSVVRADGRRIDGVASAVTDDGDVIVTTRGDGPVRLSAADVRSLRHVT